MFLWAVTCDFDLIALHCPIGRVWVFNGAAFAHRNGLHSPFRFAVLCRFSLLEVRRDGGFAFLSSSTHFFARGSRSPLREWSRLGLVAHVGRSAVTLRREARSNNARL